MAPTGTFVEEQEQLPVVEVQKAAEEVLSDDNSTEARSAPAQRQASHESGAQDVSMTLEEVPYGAYSSQLLGNPMFGGGMPQYEQFGLALPQPMFTSMPMLQTPAHYGLDDPSYQQFNYFGGLTTMSQSQPISTTRTQQPAEDNVVPLLDSFAGLPKKTRGATMTKSKNKKKCFCGLF